MFLALMVLAGVPVLALDGEQLDEAVAGSAAYILQTVKAPQVGSIGGEWAVIGLARSGREVPQEYWDHYYSTVEEYVRSCGGVLHDKKYTEYSRVALALTAIGADPRDVGGYNLLTPLGDYDKTVWQGVNGAIWALIALDSGNYDMPDNPEAETQATRQMYIDHILSRQLDDGGWTLTSNGGQGESDPDITGMALQALSRYQDQEEVRQATDKALDCMSARQNAAGGFSSWETTNLESSVQMLVALCQLGIPLDDARFVKNGNTLLDNILSFRQADGSFLHTLSGSGSNQMASEQGLYSMVAAQRAAEGKNALYQMSDVGIKISSGSQSVAGLPGKNPDVQKVAIVNPGATFADVSAHESQPAIEAMAARGIINGRGSDRFEPDATMTRAEFAAIVVRSLGLPEKTSSSFTDVPANAWYYTAVNTAHSYGIINGTGGGLFEPEGTITRQEAAVMVARAAGLCGLQTELEAAEIRDILAQFGDYVTAADWARGGLAFCYSQEILDQSELDIEPRRAALRCEIAQMLYNLLGSAGLL